MIKCPLCNHETVIKKIDDEKVTQCPSCGAFKDVNPNSGNVVWMKNGRVVMATEDIKNQQKDAESRGFDIKNLDGDESYLTEEDIILIKKGKEKNED